MALLKALGDFIATNWKELSKKRIWIALFFAIPTGVMQIVKWIKLENPIKIYTQIVFLFSITAIVICLAQYIWEKKREKWREDKREKEEEERTIKLVKERIKGFSFDELTFLLNFNGESKRATVSSQYITFLNLKSLGVINVINSLGAGLAHAEVHIDYKGEYEKIRVRFDEEVKSRIRNFSDDALDYLASFIDEDSKKKKSAYDEIEKVICMFKSEIREFEGEEEISVKSLYKNYIIDAKEELERRWQEEDKAWQEEFGKYK